MRIRYGSLLLAILGLFAFSAAVRAEGKKWALLVGVEEYDSPDINRLDFAVKDVSAVAGVLKDRLGYQTRLMTSALKDRGDPNRPTNLNVFKVLDRLAEDIGPEDTFLFYFSGHGFSEDGQNFLGSVNVDASSVETLQLSAIPLTTLQLSAIPLTTLQKKVQKLKARQVIFIMDACRNDPEKSKGGGDNKLTEDFSKSLIVAARTGGAQVGGSAVLFACSEGERAFEDPAKGQSAFTFYLLEALNGRAGGASLTMTDVADYVQKQVIAWARDHNKRQTPELKTDGAARIVLAEKVLGGSPAKTQIAPGTKINPKDGAEMIFIPAGEFLMGDDDFKNNPRHSVRLSGYYIYKNPVTVGQYKKFCQETGHQVPFPPDFNPNWSKEDHPIVRVSWEDAAAYCQWAGVQLPTEAQWEKAARGTDGRKYPFGNDFDVSKVQAGKSESGDAGGTAAVGQYGISPYGVTDMAGNVWQWCADWYDDTFWSSRQAEGLDPVNESIGEKKSRVVRGGSWFNTIPDSFRAAVRNRSAPISGGSDNGFRCAARAQ